MMTDFFNGLVKVLSYVGPGYVFVLFSAAVAAAFLVSLRFSSRGLKRYADAMLSAADYLSDERTGSLGKNNAGYFFRKYACDFPVAMQNRVAAYLNSMEVKPSRFITEADCLKPVSFGAERKKFLTVYDMIARTAFAAASAFSLAYGGAEAFGAAAVLPMTAAVALRYVLKFKNDSLDSYLTDAFYTLIDAMDAAVVLKNDPEDKSQDGILKKAAALIKELVDEERDVQRYHYINETDGLCRELRGERLKEIADNVAVVCGEDTPLATLKQIFNMLSESKYFYATKEETELLNGCLVKLKNTIIRIEKDIINL
ncbi:MAG: hypothetical protein LBP62_02990 [Clostridiales bacterium]|jgi:hypothetical protein|nr:hypothetical protein [Clostridiales bacterium]